jgi:hypothetical protein
MPKKINIFFELNLLKILPEKNITIIDGANVAKLIKPIFNVLPEIPYTATIKRVNEAKPRNRSIPSTASDHFRHLVSFK